MSNFNFKLRPASNPNRIFMVTSNNGVNGLKSVESIALADSIIASAKSVEETNLFGMNIVVDGKYYFPADIISTPPAPEKKKKSKNDKFIDSLPDVPFPEESVTEPSDEISSLDEQA